MNTTHIIKVEIGPISSDTLNPLHLIPAFADYHTHITGKAYADDTVYDREKLKRLSEETLGDILAYLTEDLEELAPDYTYFGASEEDGACFGFWPSIDSVNDDIRYGEIKRLDEVRKGEVEVTVGQYVVDVNDHGNITLYRIEDVELQEAWSCV